MLRNVVFNVARPHQKCQKAKYKKMRWRNNSGMIDYSYLIHYYVHEKEYIKKKKANLTTVISTPFLDFVSTKNHPALVDFLSPIFWCPI